MLKLNPFKLLAPFAGSNTLTGVFSQVEEVAKSLENRMEALNQWLALA